MRIHGWEKVLKFTYIQTIKAKSFIVSSVIGIVIVALMVVGINFLPKLLADTPTEFIQITDDEGNVVAEVEAYKIKKVYICDDSELAIDFSFLTEIKVEYELISSDDAEATMKMVTDSLEAVTLAVIERSEQGFNVKMSRPESTELIKNSDCFALLGTFNSAINNYNLMSLGVPAEDVPKASPYISTTVNVAGEEPKNEMAESIVMGLTMGTSAILFMLIIMYGQLTAQAVATEKASRVMELLLTSIQPLAVIVGKVLATLLVALTSIIGIGGISAGAFFLFAPYGTLGEITGMVDTSDPVIAAVSAELSNALTGFNPLNIFLTLIIFILGFLFYALIAGLIGASISKIEDLQTAMQPLMLISVLGFYLTYLSPLTGMDPDGKGSFLVRFSWYLPISSPFAIPGALLTGQISGIEIVIAIAVLVLCLVLFALFVTKVYEHIILHNGNRIKIKDMIKMLKIK